MSLKNLLKIEQLEEHETNAEQAQRLIASAERSIADARQDSISPETRLEAAYRAIMQLSMVALWANGFRPSKSKPGHHRTMIQSLVHTVDLHTDQMLLIDIFRVKRNAIDYTGKDVDEESVQACIDAATDLFVHITKWLAENRQDLIT